MKNTTALHRMPTAGRRALRVIGMVIGGVIFAVIVAFLFGYIVQYIWNWLMPELFGLKTIGYWQAFALVVLARLLVGGWGHHGHRDRAYMRERWIGSEKTGPGFPGLSVEDHGRFKHYWEEEGMKAFDDYLRRTGRDPS